jgi:hypothetical protein
MDSSEYSRQLQEKFELYLLALVFTILGLAIQTGKLGSHVWADYFELSGWMLLMFSGLIGLWRFEWLPVAHANAGNINKLEAVISDIKRHQATGSQTYLDISTGTVKPLNEIIENYSSRLDETNAYFEKIEKQTSLKYQIHRWTFIFGLLSLISSRSVEHIINLLSRFQ